MATLRCRDCQALGQPGEVLCQKCGGPVGPDEPPVTVPSPQAAGNAPTGAPATRGANGDEPERRTRKAPIQAIVAAVAVVALFLSIVGYFLYREFGGPISVAAVDGQGSLSVTNRTDKTVSVVVERDRGKKWSRVPDSKAKIKAGKTKKYNLGRGTYRVATGDFRSTEVELIK